MQPALDRSVRGKQIANEQNQKFGTHTQSLPDHMEYLHPRSIQRNNIYDRTR